MYFQSKSAVLLPTIQAAAISSMRKHDIEPLIIVIKFKNEYDCTYVLYLKRDVLIKIFAVLLELIAHLYCT